MTAVAHTVLSLFFAVVALYGLQHTRPLYSDIMSPIATSGGMKERVQANAFALSLDTIRAARALNFETFGISKPYTTSGVWIVAEGEAEARFETMSLTSAEWLSSDGVRYAITDRAPATIDLLPGNALEPGLPRRILLLFEAPSYTVAGGTIIVARNKLQPLDAEIRIATNITAKQIEPTITIRRNVEGPAWTVLPQR